MKSEWEGVSITPAHVGHEVIHKHGDSCAQSPSSQPHASRSTRQIPNPKEHTAPELRVLARGNRVVQGLDPEKQQKEQKGVARINLKDMCVDLRRDSSVTSRLPSLGHGGEGGQFMATPARQLGQPHERQGVPAEARKNVLFTTKNKQPIEMPQTQEKNPSSSNQVEEIQELL